MPKSTGTIGVKLRIGRVRSYGGKIIESDLGHADENDLKRVAKSSMHGYWLEDAALEWAKKNGKMLDSVVQPSASMASLVGKIYRTGD